MSARREIEDFLAVAQCGHDRLLIAGAVLLIWPGLVTDLIGLGVVGTIFLLQKRRYAVAEKSVAFSAG